MQSAANQMDCSLLCTRNSNTNNENNENFQAKGHRRHCKRENVTDMPINENKNYLQFNKQQKKILIT